MFQMAAFFVSMCPLWLVTDPQLLLLGWIDRRSASRRSATAATTASTWTATTTRPPGTATTAWCGCAERARRRISAGVAFFSKATATFGVFGQILFTFDAGGLRLLVSGWAFLESERHIHVAPEVIGDCH